MEPAISIHVIICNKYLIVQIYRIFTGDKNIFVFLGIGNLPILPIVMLFLENMLPHFEKEPQGRFVTN